MGKTGRPRHPDILTPREWEVLELVRERLTNEAIAQRLGISLDGAKYHVSQILSKLGVASRDEAAAVPLAERRPWWLRAVVWAKIGGAATVAAAVAGLARWRGGCSRRMGPRTTYLRLQDRRASHLHPFRLRARVWSLPFRTAPWSTSSILKALTRNVETSSSFDLR